MKKNSGFIRKLKKYLIWLIIVSTLIYFRKIVMNIETKYFKKYI